MMRVVNVERTRHMAVTLFVAVSGYVAVLISGLAADAGFALRYDSVMLPVALAGVFMGFARLPERWIAPALAVTSAVLCAAVLSGTWNSGVSDLSLMAGLFPHSDAYSYLNGGASLLNSISLEGGASRRPLISGLWGVLLFVCHGHIRCALAVMVFLCSLGIVVVTREIVRSRGWVAGYVIFLALFLYYRRFIGTSLSEHAGLLFGCIGFVQLWRAAGGAHRSLAFAGLLILALALNVRAGAFFILPAVAVWIGWRWRGKAFFSWHGLLLSVLAVGMAFAINAAVLWSVGNPRAQFGNFSYTLYGLVRGGDWQQIIHDYPDIRTLPEMERNRKIYDLAFSYMQDNPMSLPLNMVRAYREFFFSQDGPYSFFRFALQRGLVDWPPKEQTHSTFTERLLSHPVKIMQIAAVFLFMFGFLVLALVGVWHTIRAQPPWAGMMGMAMLGIMASVPFVPPWDVDLMRVHAATMPFMLVLPALGLAWLADTLGNASSETDSDNPQAERSECGLQALGFIVIPAICLCPCLFALGAHGRAADKSVAESQVAERTIRLMPGSEIGFTPGKNAEYLDRESIRRNMGILFTMYPDRAKELRAAITAGDRLALGYDLSAGKLIHVVLDDDLAQHMGQSPLRVLAEPVLPGEEPFWWRLLPLSPLSGPGAEM